MNNTSDSPPSSSQRAISRRMMLRERAAAEVEERQRECAYSKPLVALDVAWNLSFVAVSVVVLGLSSNEEPCMPLRLWILGYLLLGLFHSLFVVWEFRRRRRRRNGVLEFSSERFLENQENCKADSLQSQLTPVAAVMIIIDMENMSFFLNIMKQIESVNTILSFIWWFIGLFWVTAGGQSLTKDSPQLYWLCITFLAFDVVVVVISVSVTCLIGIAVCCCLPCILAIFYAVADKEGITKEEIDQLPNYKFRMVKERDVEESSRGLMMECDSDTSSEHVIALEDAECCICLSAYDDGAELRELPCNHHFHCACIDKWLLINATCPLCKFNILSIGKLVQEV